MITRAIVDRLWIPQLLSSVSGMIFGVTPTSALVKLFRAPENCIVPGFLIGCLLSHYSICLGMHYYGAEGRKPFWLGVMFWFGLIAIGLVAGKLRGLAAY